MSLSPGAKLGPYEIVGAIGAGGMGEVYRARDARLARDVAVKVLPASFAEDAERLRRFEQEARATGALNHPNILAVYDIGEHEGAPYVVSELLEGEPLRQRIGATPLPQRKAIDYAVQIGRGLAAAHDKGIVHRDLKPDNVFVTNDGRVKILDFGLAKVTHPEALSEADSALPTGGPPATGAGTVLGTVGYMSPEQVRGRPVDHRSDIFSLGIVLYEMLTGQRAFRGDSAVETMNAILKEDPPPITESARSLPPALDRIVAHCLEKSPEERFQSARDVAFDLEALSGLSAQTLAASTQSERSVWLKRAAAALALAALAAAVFFAGRVSSPKGSGAEFEPLTFRRGDVQTARFAPDGRSVVYSAAWEGGELGLYTTQPGSPESRSLELPRASVSSISRNGEMALIFQGSRSVLARMPLGGGAPREVLERVEWADWGPDADSLAITRFEAGRSRLEYPIGKLLHEVGGALSDVRVSPAGDRIAFAEHPNTMDERGDVAVVDLEGRKTTLSAGWEDVGGLAWGPGGREVWFTASAAGPDRSLYAVTLDGQLRRLAGVPGSLYLCDVAPDGRALVAHGTRRPAIVALPPGESEERELTWMDFSWLWDLSPDGHRVLFDEEGVAGGPGYAVYLRTTDGAPAVRLGKGGSFSLSPDGAWALAHDLTKQTLLLLPTGPGEPRELSAQGIRSFSWAGWFPDGKRLLVSGFEEGKGVRLYQQPLDGGTPTPITPEGVAPARNTLSPDAKWVAWAHQDQLLLYPVDGGEPRPVPGAEPEDRAVRWSADGRLLYVRQGRLPLKLAAIDVATGHREALREFGPRDRVGVSSVTGFVLTPDAKHYAYGYMRSLFGLYLLKGIS